MYNSFFIRLFWLSIFCLLLGVNLSLGQTSSISVASGSTSVCLQDSVAIIVTPGDPNNVSNIQWQWSIDSGTTWQDATGGFFNGDTLPQLDVWADTSLNGDLFRCLVMDTNSVVDTSNVILLKVSPLPAPVITGPSAICSGSLATLEVGTFADYVWSTQDTLDTITVSPLFTTTYSVTVSDINGCVGSDTFLLSTLPIPLPFIMGDSQVCLGSSTVLNAGIFDGYSWSTNETTATITPTPSADSIFSVTVLDSNGCSGTDSINVVVFSLPNPVIIGDSQVCVGTSAVLSPGNFDSYSWSTGESTNTINPTPSVDSIFSVTVLDSNGCSGTDSINVVVFSLPNPVIIGDSQVCVGTSAVLSPGNFDSYSWSTGESTNTINPTPSVDSIFSVTVLDSNGCSGTDSINVVVFSLPNPMIMGDSVVCLGDSTTLNAGNFSGYQWSNSDSLASIVVAPISPTIYTVTVTDSNGCVGTELFLVDVAPLPSYSKSGDSTGCIGEQVLLSINTDPSNMVLWNTGAAGLNDTIIAGTTTNVRFEIVNSWNCSIGDTFQLTSFPNPFISGPTDTSVCIGDSILLEVVSVGGGTPPYHIGWGGSSVTADSIWVVAGSIPSQHLLAVVDSNGCSSLDTTVVSGNPPPDLSLTQDTVICPGDSILLQGTSNGNNGSLNYSWMPGPNSSGQIISPSTPGTYQLTVEDSLGCTSQGSVRVDLHNLPQFIGVWGVESCAGDSVALMPTVISTALPLAFNWNSGEQVGAIYHAIADSSQWFHLEVTDTLGCQQRDSAFLTVHPRPQPLIVAPDTVCSNASGIQVKGNLGGGDQYNWSWGGALASFSSNALSTEITSGNGPGTIDVQLFSRITATTCADTADWQIYVRTESAPPKFPIVLVSSNPPLLSSTDPNSVFYNWGYDSIGVSIPLFNLSGPNVFIPSMDTSRFSYWVVTSYGNGCQTKTYYNLAPVGSSGGGQPSSRILLSPNPTRDHVNVTIHSPFRGSLRYELFNANGAILLSEVADKVEGVWSQTLNLAHLSKGVYWLRLQMRDRYHFSKLLIIR